MPDLVGGDLHAHMVNCSLSVRAARGARFSSTLVLLHRAAYQLPRASFAARRGHTVPPLGGPSLDAVRALSLGGSIR